MKINTQIRLFLPFILLIFTACHSTKKTPLFHERLQDVQYLIDQKKYSEGLDQLDQLLKEQPNNERVLALQASLYLHRAGISIKDILSLEATLSRPVKMETELLPLYWTKGQREDSELTRVLKGLNRFIAEITEFNYRVGNIPLLDKSQYQESDLALQALDQIQNPSSGTALFRSLIRILNFKYLWKQGQLLRLSMEELCESSLSSLRKRVHLSKDIIEKIITDMSRGTKKSEAELLKISNQINQDYYKLDNILKHYETQVQNFSEWIEILWESEHPQSKEKLSCWI